MQLKLNNNSVHSNFDRIVPKYIESVMKVLLEARKTWERANPIIVIRMFPVITETGGGE